MAALDDLPGHGAVDIGQGNDHFALQAKTAFQPATDAGMCMISRIVLDRKLFAACGNMHAPASHATLSAQGPLWEPLGLTYPQYLVLPALAAQDGQTVGSLGADLRFESNTLTPLLKRMETAGWLNRRRDSV